MSHAQLPNANTISDRGKARYLLNFVAENNPDVDSGPALAGRARKRGVEPPERVTFEEFVEIAAEVVDGC